MTTPSDKLDDSSLSPQEQAQTGKSAEESGSAAMSALPPYMATPNTLPATAPEPDAGQTEEQPAAPSSLGAAIAAAQAGSVISVSPDGTAVPEQETSSPAPEDIAMPNASAQECFAEPSAPESQTGFTTQEESASHPDAQANQAAPTTDKTPPEAAAASKETAATASPREKKPSSPKKTLLPPQGPAPKYPSFGQTHPILSVEQTMPPSLLSRLYAIPAVSPVVFLSLMLLLQVFLSLGSRSLWIGGEVQLAGMFQSFSNGDGLLMELNGTLQPGTPPLYFWFLHGLSLLIGSQGPVLFFLAAGISALLYVWAALGLGRLVGRVDTRTNLAAGIMLLSAVYILGVTHSAGKALMFAALTLCSCITLYRAFVSPKTATAAMIRAFVLAAAATLVSGPLGLLIPVCALVLFALWRGTREQIQVFIITLAALTFGFLPALAGLPLLQMFGLLPKAQTLPLEWGLVLLALPAIALLLLIKVLPRLRAAATISLVLLAACFVLSGGTPYFSLPPQLPFPITLAVLPLLLQATPQRLFRRDFFIGLGSGILLIILWIAAIYWTRGDLDFIRDAMLKQQILHSVVQGLSALPDSWHYYLTRLPLAIMPWTLLILFLPWERLFGKSMRECCAASRTPAREGLAFLFCLILATLALLTLNADKNPHQLLPMFPPLAVLAARVLMGIAGKRATYFRYTLAALIFVSGVAALLGTLMLFGALPKPDCIPIPWVLPTSGGFFAAGVALMLTGLMLWLAVGSSRPEGILLVMAVCATLVGYSLGSLSAPALDPVLGPKHQSLLLRAYADKQYEVASYSVEAGIYSYYARRAIPALDDLEEAKTLAGKGKLAIAMPLAEAEAWAGKPECLQEVHRQSLGSQTYVILACPPVQGLAPADDPFTGGFDIIEEVKTLLRDLGVPVSTQQPAGEKIPVPAVRQPVSAEEQPSEQKPAEPEAVPQEQNAVPAPPSESQDAAPVPEQAPAQGGSPEEQKTPEPAEAPDPAKQTPLDPAEKEQAPASQETPATPDAQSPPHTPDAAQPAAPQETDPEQATPSAPDENAPENNPAPQEQESVPEDTVPPAQMPEPALEPAPSTADA